VSEQFHPSLHRSVRCSLSIVPISRHQSDAGSEGRRRTDDVRSGQHGQKDVWTLCSEPAPQPEHQAHGLPDAPRSSVSASESHPADTRRDPEEIVRRITRRQHGHLGERGKVRREPLDEPLAASVQETVVDHDGDMLRLRHPRNIDS
jgi:hypothetical protein